MMNNTRITYTESRKRETWKESSIDPLQSQLLRELDLKHLGGTTCNGTVRCFIGVSLTITNNYSWRGALRSPPQVFQVPPSNTWSYRAETCRQEIAHKMAE